MQQNTYSSLYIGFRPIIQLLAFSGRRYHRRNERQSMHIPFFRIFYSTTFTLLSLLLLTLLLITPADQIRQAFLHGEIYNIFIVAGAHLLTLVIAIFLYASRLFNNRSVLANIPRPWSPVENGDMGKRVRCLIVESLRNSAMIAFQARPRDLSGERQAEGQNVPRSHNDEVEDSSPGANAKPAWGIISHVGWSSPSSTDLSSLHYDPVIQELAHLIEAKAVSLAPGDPISLRIAAEPPPPDPFAVALLQRPANMALRDYVWYLTSLDMIHPSNLGDDFLAIYEKARFSNRPLDETDFRALMHIFAAILRGMTTLNPNAISAGQESPTSDPPSSLSVSDQASLNSQATVEYTPRPDPSLSANASPASSVRSPSASGIPHA